MPRREDLPLCPNDACPMWPFRTVKAAPGYTIALYGCRFCNFDHVFAIAHDAADATRFVAHWCLEPSSGLYVVASENEQNPPGWLELASSALPERK